MTVPSAPRTEPALIDNVPGALLTLLLVLVVVVIGLSLSMTAAVPR